MANDLPGVDAKTIWQEQPTETPTMTLKLIRWRARDLHTKTRRQLLGTVTTPLIVAFFYAWTIKQFPSPQQVLHPLFAFALAWSLAGLYFLNRGKWRETMPGDAGFSAGLDFCRQEIERRRDYLRRSLWWAFGPALFTIAVFVFSLWRVAGAGSLPKAMPFLTLVVAWIAAYFFISRVRQQRELQREIDELKELES